LDLVAGLDAGGVGLWSGELGLCVGGVGRCALHAVGRGALNGCGGGRRWLHAVLLRVHWVHVRCVHHREGWAVGGRVHIILRKVGGCRCRDICSVWRGCIGSLVLAGHWEG
jgi:hypothetical protein